MSSYNSAHKLHGVFPSHHQQRGGDRPAERFPKGALQPACRWTTDVSHYNNDNVNCVINHKKRIHQFDLYAYNSLTYTHRTVSPIRIQQFDLYAYNSISYTVIQIITFSWIEHFLAKSDNCADLRKISYSLLLKLENVCFTFAISYSLLLKLENVCYTFARCRIFVESRNYGEKKSSADINIFAVDCWLASWTLKLLLSQILQGCFSCN